MALPGSVSWGSYRAFEGPFYRGKNKIGLLSTRDFIDETMYVMSQTEGCADSVNMYDMGICSLGMIQWIDVAPQHSVVNMLGYVIDNHSDPKRVLDALKPALSASDASIVKTTAGVWRWKFNDGRVVTSADLQRELYFRGASGKIGTWSDTQKAHAKTWAAALATVFEDAEAIMLQAKYTKPRMMGFVTLYAKQELFSDTSPEADTPLSKALKNAYISYAGNNPLRASNSLRAALSETVEPKWSSNWVADVLKSLVYASGVKIYPERYNKIRPVINMLYGVTLPTLAELQARVAYRVASHGLFKSISDIQDALTKLGYNPGKSDGIIGAAMIAALKKFQEDNKLVATGSINDVRTIALLASMIDASVKEPESPVAAAPVVDEPKEEPVVEIVDNKPASVDLVTVPKDTQKSTTIIMVILNAIIAFFRMVLERRK